MRDDIKIALEKNKEANRLYNTFMFKNMLKGIEDHLKGDEKVFYIRNNNITLKPEGDVKPNAFKFTKKTAVLVAITEKRVIFYQRVYPNEHLEQIPIKDIRSVDLHKDMYSSKIRITALRKVVDIDSSVNKKEYKLLTDTLDKVMNLAKESTSTIVNHAAESKEDAVKALRELASLRNDGIISDAEFEQKKIELLAKI